MPTYVMVWLALVLTLVAGCADRTREIFYEIRMTDPELLKPDTFAYIVTAKGYSRSSSLNASDFRQEGCYRMFRESGLLHEDGRRYAVVLGGPYKTSYVFVLPFSRPPDVPEWTPWVRPTYVETGGAMDFLKRGAQGRTGGESVPLEMRYRIERWEMPGCCR